MAMPKPLSMSFLAWQVCVFVLQPILCQKQGADMTSDMTSNRMLDEIGELSPCSVLHCPRDSHTIQTNNLSLKAEPGEKLIATQLMDDQAAGEDEIFGTRRRKSSRRRRRRRSGKRRRRRRRRSGKRRRRRRTPAPAPPRRRKSTDFTPPAPSPGDTDAIDPVPAPSPEGGPDCGAIRASSINSIPIKDPPGCKCQQYCYIWGDPNFVTFDGMKFRFTGKVDKVTGRGTFWAVSSTRVKIQGLHTDEGAWMQGVAVGGPFLGNHKLVAYRDPRDRKDGIIRIVCDGMDATGSCFNGMAEVNIDTGRNHLPDRETLHKVFKGSFASGPTRTALDQWLNSQIVTIKLPENVEIFMIMDTFSPMHTMRKSVQVIIKMPPKGAHGGWCGNFNGEANDDRSSTYMEEVQGRENWFARAPDLPRRRLLLMQTNSSRTDPICAGQPDMTEEGIRAVESACEHIADPDIRSGCIEDMCTTGDATALEAADDIAIVKVMNAAGVKQCEVMR